MEFVQRSASDWEAAVRAGFVSTIQLLSPAELARGLAAFRTAYPDGRQRVDYELKWNSIRGRMGRPRTSSIRSDLGSRPLP